MTHALSGSFDDTDGYCTKCGCLHCICKDEMTKCPTCDGDGKDRDSAMADVACVICSGTGIDPDTEYDVDGVYTAKELAEEIQLILKVNHESDGMAIHAIIAHLISCGFMSE